MAETVFFIVSGCIPEVGPLEIDFFGKIGSPREGVFWLFVVGFMEGLVLLNKNLHNL